MKIREILRSDLIHVIPMYGMWMQELGNNPPYPFRTAQTPQDYGYFIMGQIKAREQILDAGQICPWESFVAIPQGNVPKGFIEACIEERPYAEPKRICKILQLYVEPKSRNQGISQLLIKQVMSWAGKIGVQAFEVSYTNGSEAHKMWAKLGVRTYTLQGVFADDNWKPLIEEGEVKWASARTPEVTPTISSETKDLPKETKESSEIPKKEKMPLTLVKDSMQQG